MDIQSAEIKYFSLDSLWSRDMDGVKHVKVLPWLSVVQAVEGSYDIRIGTKKQENTGEGGFFIAPAGVRQSIVHRADPYSGNMRARWLFIDTALNKTDRPERLFEFPTVLPKQYEKELDGVFDKLFSADGIFEKYSCIYKVLDIVFAAASPKEKRESEAMLRLSDYIGENYMNKIRIEDMAGLLHMSHSNFYAVFRRCYGMSPIAYINKFRISVAAQLLRNTDDTVAKIALSVGVGDPLYFDRLFRREYGMSPVEYRKKI